MFKSGKIFKYLIILVLITYIYNLFSIYTYSRSKYNGKAGAIIVLGAAAWGNRPSPVFRERINHAINIYNKGKSKYIIFTGGPGFPSEPGESVIAKKYAIKNGVKKESILIENYSKNTLENLLFAKQISEKYKLESYILVSDPFHLKRAAVIAENLKMKVYASATPTSRYVSTESRLKFLLREAYYLMLYKIKFFFDK